MAPLSAEVERRALAAARALARHGRLRRAYLFGSHLEGRADRWSDIDVAAFMDGVETWDLRRRARVMAEVQEEVGYDVEAHLFPSAALEMSDPASFAEHIIRHGLRIWEEDTQTDPTG